MTSQTKSATAQLYRIRYSNSILKLEIIIVAMMFFIQLVLADEIWLLPSLLLSTLISFIFFSKYSIKNQFSQDLCCQFRSAPERLIWYDSTGEFIFLIQDMDIRMTRWFVLITLNSTSKRLHRVLLQDSFENMNDYTGFRRRLLLLNSAVAE